MRQLYFTRVLSLFFTLLLSFAHQSYGQQEPLKRSFQSGKGTCVLFDESQLSGRIKLAVSQPNAISVIIKGQPVPVFVRLDQIKYLTVERDTFVVVHDISVPRYKQKLLTYVQDPQDTMRVAQALVQRHINRGGIELLRYIGTLEETTFMSSVGGTAGGSFGSTEYYTCYLFRRNKQGSYRTIAGESAPIKRYFAAIVADKPVVRQYLLEATFVELKLPRILDIYLISKGF